MKNLPHQISQLPRLNAALRVLVDLVDNGRAIDDDGTFGDALVRSQVHPLRNAVNGPIDELLAQEHRKPVGSQGSRTAARDLRRFFRLLGFIERPAGGAWVVSDSTRMLMTLNSALDVPRMHDIWRQALLDLVLEDSRGISHPYRILLRLVVEIPGLPKPFSGLCLEAADDSAGEFARIVALAALPDPAATMRRVAGKNMAANSIKILPPLAVQLGDIIDTAGQLSVNGWVSDALFDPGRTRRRETAVRNLVRRPFSPRQRVIAGRRQLQNSGITTRRYDPDLVGARFNDHEDCLDRLSQIIPAQIEQFEAIYDLLVVANEAMLLVEAKTIRNDERAQVRTAVGQLYYYAHFDVQPLYPNRQIKRLLLVDRPLADEVCEFLTEREIGVIWIPPDVDLGGSALGLRQLEQFDIRR